MANKSNLELACLDVGSRIKGSIKSLQWRSLHYTLRHQVILGFERKLRVPILNCVAHVMGTCIDKSLLLNTPESDEKTENISN